MSSENQRLHVALIVFTTLSVVLAVTSFVLLRRYRDAASLAAAEQQQVEQIEELAREKQLQIDRLKRVLGHPPSASMDAVEKRFDADMQTCALGLPEEDHFYATALRALHEVIARQSATIAEIRAEVRDWQAECRRQRAVDRSQADQWHEQLAAAGADVLDQREKLAADRERLNRSNQSVLGALAEARREADAAVAAAGERYDGLHDQYRIVLLQLENALKKLDQLEGRGRLLPQGVIRKINYRLRVAWINLGRAEGLSEHVPFDVYPAGMASVLRTDKKGEIEVTRILDDHWAQAQVIEDQLGDPLVPGDRVHSTSWSPHSQ